MQSILNPLYWKLDLSQVDWLVQPARPYQTLLVNSRTGNLDVLVSLPKTGFLSSSAGSDQILLNLVQDAGIEPESVTIFHHNKKQVLKGIFQWLSFIDWIVRSILCPWKALSDEKDIHEPNEFYIWREIQKCFLIFRQLLLQFKEADILNFTLNMKVYFSLFQP